MHPIIDRDYAPRWYVPRISLRAVIETLLMVALAVSLMLEG